MQIFTNQIMRPSEIEGGETEEQRGRDRHTNREKNKARGRTERNKYRQMRTDTQKQTQRENTIGDTEAARESDRERAREMDDSDLLLEHSPSSGELRLSGSVRAAHLLPLLDDDGGVGG